MLLLTKSYGQEMDSLVIDKHADCDNRLTIKTQKIVGPTTSPKGYGKELEFEGNEKNSLHFIEQENNTVWYQFETKTSGQLIFELEPLDSLNDYDFALYKYTDDNFCELVEQKEILPIRTNFSRNKLEIAGKTGLALSALNEWVGAGVQPAYSKAVRVNPQEIYVLLVNNVYANGKGHTLHFNYFENMRLDGQVVDADGAALGANITLTNTKTGDVVAQTISDSVTGNYSLVFDLPKSQARDPLHVEVFKKDYFFFDTLIMASKLTADMRNVKLKTPIKKIKKGASFVVSNILFYGDSPKPLPKALLSIKALYKTMERNKKLKISIEGHTNGCDRGEDFALNLSRARAATIYNYLVEQGIDKDRLSSIGYGCKHLLHDTGGRLAHLNRRVEIEIVEL
ncbi:OmpA family protein [Aureispira anguillae]|nr:OmpA family protein [Aureispira anguillae]